MKTNHTLSMTAALLILTAGPAARGAAPVSITITNPGFENPALAEGDWTSDNSIIGWIQINGADIGVWNVGPADFPNGAAEGLNVAYLYVPVNGQGFGQVLSGATGLLQRSASYTLTVAVGNSASYAAFPGYQVQLLAGGTLLAQDENTLTPAEGRFVTSTVTYTYASAHSALVGQPLEIRLLSKGQNSSEEMEFDDVRLTVTVMPLTSGAVLIVR